MNLGTYSSYRLPADLRESFGVDTAQQLVDSLGVEGELTPELARDAESAYVALRGGDETPARSLLGGIGVSDESVDTLLARFARR